MLHKLYVIFDNASGLYASPTLAVTEAEVRRNFSTIVNAEGNAISANPQDFSLYELGIFDNETGKFSLLDTPTRVMTALELKQKV